MEYELQTGVTYDSGAKVKKKDLPWPPTLTLPQWIPPEMGAWAMKRGSPSASMPPLRD